MEGESQYPLRTFRDVDSHSGVEFVHHNETHRMHESHASTSSQRIPRKPVALPQVTAYAAIENDQHSDLLPNSHAERKSVWAHFSSSTAAWIPEILAMVLAVVCLVAIAVVLRVYDRRGINDLHLPDGLTLNGLIALIATFQRVFLIVPVSSLISQEAWLWLEQNERRSSKKSRLQDLSLSDAASRGAWGSFLVLFRSNGRMLTITAAVITILSLLVGTFTQQLIRTSVLPITDALSPLNPGNIPNSKLYRNFQGNLAESPDLEPKLNAKAAIYNGLLTSNIPVVEATCPTGNCSFPDTPSLAVCGSCEPLTFTQSGGNSTRLNYTTSTGNVLTLGNFTADNYNIGFTVKSTAVKDLDNAIYVAGFEMMGYPYQTLSSEIDGPGAALPKASRCQMWMCVNIYATTISNGQQNQSTIASYRGIPFNWTDFSVRLLNITLGEEWQAQGQNYSVDSQAVIATSNYLYKLTQGNIYLDLESYTADNDGIEGIWNGTLDQDVWITSFTRSLTNMVRQDMPANLTIYNGIAFQTSVEISWWWITLPVALTVASILLLIVVIDRTARSKVGVWKGNPLSMLLFDRDPNLMDNMHGEHWQRSTKGLDDKIGGLRAALTKTDQGKWLLQTE